jgi:hypothetical protein
MSLQLPHSSSFSKQPQKQLPEDIYVIVCSGQMYSTWRDRLSCPLEHMFHPMEVGPYCRIRQFDCFRTQRCLFWLSTPRSSWTGRPGAMLPSSSLRYVASTCYVGVITHGLSVVCFCAVCSPSLCSRDQVSSGLLSCNFGYISHLRSIRIP